MKGNTPVYCATAEAVTLTVGDVDEKLPAIHLHISHYKNRDAIPVFVALGMSSNQQSCHSTHKHLCNLGVRA